MTSSLTRPLVLVTCSALLGLAGCPRGEATPHPCPGQLAPLEVQVASTAQSVLLTWDAHNRATAFRVERATSRGGPFETVGEVVAPTFVDDDAAADQRYFYKVHAVGDGCEAPAHAAHEAFGPAAAPVGVFAQAFSEVGVSISWDDAGANTSGFIVQKRAPDGAWETADERGPAATASNLGGFRPDTIYTMRVGAQVPTSIEPTWSETATVLTFPRSLLDVVVEAIGPSSVRVSFINNNPNATSIEVGKKRSNDFFFTDYADLPAGSTSFVDDTLEEWVFYRYRLIVHNAAGESEDVEVPAAAWLPPRLFWEGAPELSDTCVMTLDGSFQIDLGHGAELAGAVGEATGVGAPPLSVGADQTGVDVDLGQAWEGVLDVTWSLTDSFGQTRSASRTVELERASVSEALGVGRPTASIDGVSAEGHQMLLPADDFARVGCDDACLGRRASVALGAAHSCVLDEEGGVLCAGAGPQLGRGASSPASADALDSVCFDELCTDALKEVVQLAAGDAFTCALQTGGDVRCWGDGGLGQLGGPASSTWPVLVTTGAVGITAGAAHACSLRADGTAACWGANDAAQLGRGSPSTSEPVGTVCDVEVGGGPGCPALMGLHAIAAGGGQTCGLTGGDDGVVVCWGASLGMAAADGGIGSDVALEATAIPCGEVADERCVAGELQQITSLALGEGFACASGGGRVACWGEGTSGQLGDGQARSSPTPVEVVAAIDGVPLSSAVTVSAGDTFACAQDAAAYVRCWGELTSGAASLQATPLCNAGLSCGTPDAESIAAAVGGGHACVVDLGGRLRCFGGNSDGQLAAGAVGAESDAVVSGCVGAACASFERAARRSCGPMGVTSIASMDASDDN